jgi:hypothetical protein
VNEITGTINDCAHVNEVHTFYKFTFLELSLIGSGRPNGAKNPTGYK